MSTRTIAVIPAHNESATIADVVARSVPHVQQVLVIDDGSSDDTEAKAAAAGARVIRLVPNQGKGAALRRGLEEALAAGAEAVVTLDADGEHHPEDIPALVAALDTADVVLGTREVFRSGARRVVNAFALFWFRLLDPTIRDTICGFRAFRASALPVVQNDAGGFAYEHEVILRAVEGGLKLASVPVQVTSREGSHVTRREMVRANNHFDRFVLRRVGGFRIAAWRKVLLVGGCAAGLAAGTAALALMPAPARKAPGPAA